MLCEPDLNRDCIEMSQQCKKKHQSLPIYHSLRDFQKRIANFYNLPQGERNFKMLKLDVAPLNKLSNTEA